MSQLIPCRAIPAFSSATPRWGRGNVRNGITSSSTRFSGIVVFITAFPNWRNFKLFRASRGRRFHPIMRKTKTAHAGDPGLQSNVSTHRFIRLREQPPRWRHLPDGAVARFQPTDQVEAAPGSDTDCLPAASDHVPQRPAELCGYLPE